MIYDTCSKFIEHYKADTELEICTSVKSSNHVLAFKNYEYFLLEESENTNFEQYSENAIISKKLGIKPIIIDIDSYTPQMTITYNNNYEYHNNGILDDMIRHIKAQTVQDNDEEYDINKLTRVKTIVILPVLDFLYPEFTIGKLYYTNSHDMYSGRYSNNLVPMEITNTNITYIRNWIGFNTNSGYESVKLDQGFKYGYISVHSDTDYPGITLHYNSGHTYDILKHQCYETYNGDNSVTYFFTCDPINIPFSEILKFQILPNPSTVYISDEFVDTNGKNMIYKQPVLKIYMYNEYIDNAEALELPISFNNIPFTDTNIVRVSTNERYHIYLYS